MLLDRQYYFALAASCTLFSILSSIYAGNQPDGAGWRFFSYHPLFMTLGFVGMMGNAALVKQYIGGYKYTKVHGYLAFAGLLSSLVGFYVIFLNKQNMGKNHLTSVHAKAGMFVILSSVAIGIAGSVFLHPDWGLAKTNKLYRAAHKWGGRFIVAMGWFVCFSGLSQLTADTLSLALFGLPLIVLLPFTLL